MLQLLQRLFGKSYLNKIMGTRTNVAKPTRMDENSPFKKYSDDAFKDPKALDYIENKINEYGPYALSNKNPQEIANFEANAQRLLDAKNRQTGTTPGMVESMKPKPEAEIIDIGTGKKIDDEGIMTLKERAPQIDTKASANLEEDIAKLTDRQAREYSANIESYRRPIIRQMLLKDTKIKLPDDVRKSLENKMDLDKGADPKMDPLRLLNEYYDIDFNKLDELEEIRFTARNEFEAADEFLEKGGLEPKKDLGDKLKDLPDDIDPDALADGGRPGFRIGSGKKGVMAIKNLINEKFGKKTMTTADDIAQPDSAKLREEFDAFNQRNDKSISKAMDEVGGNFTGDMKYDADVLADEIAFQRGLIPEGGDLTDIADQTKRMDLYDEAYSAVSKQFLKNREMKKNLNPENVKLSYADKDKRIIPEGLTEEDIDFAILKGEFERKYSKLIPEDLMKKIMADDDPQRVKDIIGHVEQAAIMTDKGMSADQVIDAFKNTPRTKQADGGLNYLMGL